MLMPAPDRCGQRSGGLGGGDRRRLSSSAWLSRDRAVSADVDVHLHDCFLQLRDASYAALPTAASGESDEYSTAVAVAGPAAAGVCLGALSLKAVPDPARLVRKSPCPSLCTPLVPDQAQGSGSSV